jgi:hypothetical protein
VRADKLLLLLAMVAALSSSAAFGIYVVVDSARYDGFFASLAAGAAAFFLCGFGSCLAIFGLYAFCAEMIEAISGVKL